MFIGCDISGELSTDKYWVLGSSWLPKKQLPKYEEAICHFRLKNKMWGELKWCKISPQKINEYKEFIKVSLQEFDIHCKLIILETLDKKKRLEFPNGDSGSSPE